MLSTKAAIVPRQLRLFYSLILSVRRPGIIGIIESGLLVCLTFKNSLSSSPIETECLLCVITPSEFLSFLGDVTFSLFLPYVEVKLFNFKKIC
ncbi:12474_t:CDS:2 [Entrophospora sp. SA101]|nr:12474_t:CDS:2 [Entrophospora sp. SA101]